MERERSTAKEQVASSLRFEAVERLVLLLDAARVSFAAKHLQTSRLLRGSLQLVLLRGSCSASCGGGTRTEELFRGSAAAVERGLQDADESRRGSARMGRDTEN